MCDRPGSSYVRQLRRNRVHNANLARGPLASLLAHRHVNAMHDPVYGNENEQGNEDVP